MSSMNFTYDVCGREVLSCTFVNGMKFTCDVCGREVFTCTFVNGMKFCAKCYQETFGETDKDRKIADLEAKLAESEKEIEYQESMKILAIENKNQKAIEQLEKFKEFVSRQLFITTEGCSDLDEAEAKGCNELREETIKEIDNQINELKGE